MRRSFSRLCRGVQWVMLAAVLLQAPTASADMTTQAFALPSGGGSPHDVAVGIATPPDGAVYYASLAGNHIARVDLDTGAATIIEPPTKNQGARRVWSDSKNRVWVSEWSAGNVSRYDPAARAWKTWKLPG